MGAKKLQRTQFTMVLTCITMLMLLIVCVVIDEDEIKLQIQLDAKNVERLAERAYCRDFSRLGFGTLATPSRSRTEPFRLTMVNSMYTVCPRFVPSTFLYESCFIHMWLICEILQKNFIRLTQKLIKLL